MKRSESADRAGRVALFVLAATSAPWLVRCTLLFGHPRAPSATDLLGGLSDLGASLLFAGLLLASARLGGWAVYTLLVPWCLLHYGHFEHVRELGAALQLDFAKYLLDPTFLRGSVLSPGRPWLLTIVLVIPAALATCGLRRPFSSGSWRPVGLLGLVVSGAFIASPPGEARQAWRVRHFVHDNLGLVLRRVVADDATRAEPARSSADLSGTPRIALPASSANVLLVIMEGVPATAIRAITSRHGITTGAMMPGLSRIAERGLVASNFVLHQRQTNRGLYALLCGEHPKLDPSLAKMTLYQKDDRRDCLPRVLSAAGYRTVYLQAAPLAFMYKDAFMRLAGFERVEGNRDFAHPITRSYWGVDDRSLMRRALELARALDAEPSPYFLTLLTVGTHHPPTVPPAFVAESGLSKERAAVDYLDLALEELMTGLEEHGLLDDTLVLVTADESKGDEGQEELLALVSQNWGPLVVLAPGASPMLVDEPYGQSDVALSIIDYLGLDAGATPFAGRSLFRSYESPRRVVFSNVFLHRSGALDSSGLLHYCDESASSCTTHITAPPGLFVPTGEARRGDADAMQAIRSAIEASRLGMPAPQERFSYELIGDPVVPVTTIPRQQLLHGQNLELPAGSRLTVEIELSVDGDRGTLDLGYRMMTRNDRLLTLHIPGLAAGDRAVIEYDYAALEAVQHLKFVLVARAEAAGELTVRFERARMSVRPLEQPPAMERSGVIGEPRAEAIRSTAKPASDMAADNIANDRHTTTARD